MKASGLILAGLMAGATAAQAGGVKTIYVAPDGNDAASGSWWHPFATFERAQEAVKKFKEATPIGMLPAILPSTVVERVELLVDTRAELFEFLGATARMVRARQFDAPLIAETLARGRELLRRQVRFLFSAELDGEPDGVLAALDLLLSFESWDLLREDQGLDVAAARGVLTTGAVRLLGAG